MVECLTEAVLFLLFRTIKLVLDLKVLVPYFNLMKDGSNFVFCAEFLPFYCLSSINKYIGKITIQKRLIRINLTKLYRNESLEILSTMVYFNMSLFFSILACLLFKKLTKPNVNDLLCCSVLKLHKTLNNLYTFYLIFSLKLTLH